MRIPIPRQHGSWAMWILPFMTGAIAVGFPAREWVILTSLFFAYLTLAPIESLAKSRGDRMRNFQWLSFYMVLSGAFGVPLFHDYPLLAMFPIIALVSLVVNLYFIRRRAERHLLNDLMGIIALSSTFMLAHYIGTGHVTEGDILHNVIFIGFFFGSALHIKSHIRNRLNTRWHYVSMAYSFVLTISLLYISGSYYLTMGQLVAFLRTVMLPQQSKPNIAIIATVEVITSLIFSTLFTIMLLSLRLGHL